MMIEESECGAMAAIVAVVDRVLVGLRGGCNLLVKLGSTPKRN